MSFVVMTTQKINLIKSQKGTKRGNSKSGDVAELSGYLYYNTNSANTVAFGVRHYWKCINCPARMTTTNEDIVASVGKHSCEKSAKEVSFYYFNNIYLYF